MPASHQFQQEYRRPARRADTCNYELALWRSAPRCERDTRAAGGRYTKYLDDRTNCLHWERLPSRSTAAPRNSGQPTWPNKEGLPGKKPVSCAPLHSQCSQSWAGKRDCRTSGLSGSGSIRQWNVRHFKTTYRNMQGRLGRSKAPYAIVATIGTCFSATSLRWGLC